MSGRFERFDARPGGSYRMIHTYSDPSAPGKSTPEADIVEARFIELEPDMRFVQAVDFVSDDPAYAGTMTLTWQLAEVDAGTRVETCADNVPLGVLATHVPEPLVSREGEIDPEQAAVLGDSVGLALLVVLDTLAPAERLAFVLHDVFGVPFDEIAPIVGRTPAATRQLASRARRRVRGAPVPDADLGRQRLVVDAFFAAARAGDFEALLAVLDPDVVVRADFGTLLGGSRVVRGAQAVAEQTLTFAQFTRFGRPAVVNGAVGVVAAEPGRRYSVVGFTVRRGKIVEIDIFADPARLRQLDLAGLDG